MKKLFTGIFSLSLIFLSACNNDISNFELLPEQNLNSFAKPKIKTDWYANLSPELQKYYSDAKGKTGEELFDSLHDITSRNVSIRSYQDSKSYMYAKADNIEVNNKTGLYDSYSYVFIPGSGGDGNLYKEQADENKDGRAQDFINCEHTWPQSFFGKSLPMVADLHHLFPTLSVPNGMRSDNPFGMVAPDSVVYSTIGGSKLGVVDSKNRSLKEIKRIINLPEEERMKVSGGLGEVFEPGDRQKGNTARGMLYFYLRYYDRNIRQGSFNESEFWDSKVNTFIKWSESTDLVDEQEKIRHELVFQKQGNRNPFIDIPNLASLIGDNVLKSK